MCYAVPVCAGGHVFNCNANHNVNDVMTSTQHSVYQTDFMTTLSACMLCSVPVHLEVLHDEWKVAWGMPSLPVQAVFQLSLVKATFKQTPRGYV